MYGKLDKTSDVLYKYYMTKQVSLHSLRHSYATHLLEEGTDLRYIQKRLGHKSSKTIEVYIHVSKKAIGKIKDPMDDFFDDLYSEFNIKRVKARRNTKLTT